MQERDLAEPGARSQRPDPLSGRRDLELAAGDEKKVIAHVALADDRPPAGDAHGLERSRARPSSTGAGSAANSPWLESSLNFPVETPRLSSARSQGTAARAASATTPATPASAAFGPPSERSSGTSNDPTARPISLHPSSTPNTRASR